MKNKSLYNYLLLLSFAFIIGYAIINLVIGYYILNCNDITQYINLLELDVINYAYIARLVTNFMQKYYQLSIIIILIISLNLFDILFLILIFSTTLLYMKDKFKYFKTMIITNFLCLISYSVMGLYILGALNSLKLSSAFELFNIGTIIFAIINIFNILLSIRCCYKIIKYEIKKDK